MSDLKFCQGSKCHTYQTQDRIKGTKGNKTNQTRRRSSFYYGDDNFCSMNCYNDWFNKFGNQAINHFGRLTQAKILTEENGWTKRLDYRSYRQGEEDRYYYYNHMTEERRELTQEQYEDRNYTLNTI
jgi:hypothetical protein